MLVTGLLVQQLQTACENRNVTLQCCQAQHDGQTQIKSPVGSSARQLRALHKVARYYSRGQHVPLLWRVRCIVKQLTQAPGRTG